ncbi:MAG: hypothetical protein JNM61_07185 [Zoogloeaceae bacterium]|nr:hypothetical protein [Zoogloeaceae bacterium]
MSGARHPGRMSLWRTWIAPCQVGLGLAGALGAGCAPALAAGSNDASVVEAAPAPLSAKPPAQAAESEDSHWAVAPIRWGGTLSAGLRRRESDSGSATSENFYEARLRVASYLVEPWIARVSGDLSFFLLNSDTDGGTFGSNKQRGMVVSGTGTLNLFPQSRFPFQASYAVSDSRNDGRLTNTDYRSDRLSLRQEYRPEQGRWRTFAQYDRSELDGSFGRDEVDRFSGGFYTSGDHQVLDLTGSYARNTRTDGASSTEFLGTARHTFQVDEALSLETLGTVTDTDLQADPSVSSFSGNVRTLQAYTFGNWAPLDSPWRASGTLRYFTSKNDFGQASSGEVSIFGGTFSANYLVNRNFSLLGSLSANRVSSRDSQSTTASQAVGFNYSSDPLTFGNYSYNWYGSANATRVSAQESSQQAMTGNLGHSIFRNWALTEASALHGTFSQSFSTTRARGGDTASINTLTHSLGLSLQATPREDMRGYIGFTVSDSRSQGDTDSSFQLVNLQLNGTWRISPQSQFDANLTWQKTNQSAESRQTNALLNGFSNNSRDTNLSGNVNYVHTRVFGIPRLRYALRFTSNAYGSNTRLMGDPDGTREQISRELDQRLTYAIGRSAVELQFRTAEVDGKENALLFLKITRAFGAY